MAEHTLETRILLRYGTYTQWMASNTILKVGEAAVCAFPQNRIIEGMTNSKPDYTPPAVGIKIGDGQHYFRELPWVQGIAADVYNWAKSASKPTYTAQEIQGLQNFVESLVSGDVEVTIAPRIYQLVEGTGDNENKYYLRYKENNEESNWILDTTTYIDLNDFVNVANWIGNLVDDYPNIGTFTGTQTLTLIGQLNVIDNEVNNQFVTAVSENAGIITVERARPTFSNISGIATVQQGGTGRNTLTENSVLVGNGTDQVTLIPIADAIAANNHLVPNYLIKAYVDNATAGLTGAMHFIGEATVVINNNSSVDPRIIDYDFSSANLGDVILYNAKEFVWTGNNWRLLGDEGSYAVKGSITDSDIHEDANIAQSKIAGLDEALAGKVNVEEGKVLSDNNYSDEEKQKLQNIEERAQVNIIEHITVDGIELNVDETKTVAINTSPAIQGAKAIATDNTYEEIPLVNKFLEFARIAKTGKVDDLTEDSGTYVILNCGSSTTVI